jgi:hypothetical protein
MCFDGHGQIPLRSECGSVPQLWANLRYVVLWFGTSFLVHGSAMGSHSLGWLRTQWESEWYGNL